MFRELGRGAITRVSTVAADELLKANARSISHIILPRFRRVRGALDGAVLTTLYRAQRFTVRVVAERTGVEYMALSTGKSRTQP